MTSNQRESGPNVNPDESGDGRLSYPTHQVLSVFHNATGATAALKELADAGIPLDTITVYHGEAGAETLTATAEGGSGGWVTRLIRTFGGEQEGIREYEQAVIDGGYLLSVPAETDEEKERVRDLVKANGGEYLRYYGRGVVEDL